MTQPPKPVSEIGEKRLREIAAKIENEWLYGNLHVKDAALDVLKAELSGLLEAADDVVNNRSHLKPLQKIIRGAIKMEMKAKLGKRKSKKRASAQKVVEELRLHRALALYNRVMAENAYLRSKEK